MKVAIKQEVLVEALEKGALAALSDQAQSDTSNLAMLIKSVKISVDDNFTVESSTNLVAIKYSVEAKQENGISVDDKGSTLVPAKELLTWIKAQGKDSTIGICLKELDSPEIINPVGDIEDSDRFAIKKMGTIKLTSKDSSKTTSKWELDCFTPDQVNSVDFDKKGVKLFDVLAEEFSTALNKVIFAILPKDPDKILDAVSIQAHKDTLYFCTTDTRRCALYNVSAKVSKADTGPVLVPSALLDQVSKASCKDNTLAFHYNEDLNRVFIDQKNLSIRVAAVEKDSVKLFPKVHLLIEKDYDLLCQITKESMQKMLTAASIVNSRSALFTFTPSKNSMTVKAISESGKHRPNTSNAGVMELEKEASLIWGVTHLREGLKAIGADLINVHVPDNMKSVRITGENEDKFLYYAMFIDNPKYK